MAISSSRSLALLAGLLLLGGCSYMPDWSKPDWFSSEPERQGDRQADRQAGRPVARATGAMMADLLPQDDEAAIDEREVTKPRRVVIPRTGAGGRPPKLTVLYVTNGRIRAYGSQIIVRGTVDDDGDVAIVTINGKPALVKDRSFSKRVPAPIGETDVVVRAEDDDGNATEARFVIVRTPAGQRLVPQRPAQQELSAPEYRYMETATGAPVPRLEDVQEPGVYMILLAGTPSAHFVRMPSLAQCREAVEYTENAACAFHRGRN